MEKVTPQEALQRMFTAQLEGAQTGMRMAKSKGSIVVPEFVNAMGNDYSISSIPNENSTLYFFNNGSGGLVLPAYDVITPVLGESDNADYSLEMPVNVKALFDYYTDNINDYIDYLASEPEIPNDNTNHSDASGATESREDIYLETANWGQGELFNAKLDFGNGPLLVGCPAVMTGIILHYWGKKGYYRGCPSTPAYSKYFFPNNSNYVVAPKNSYPIFIFDYANLPDGIPQTEKEKQAVSVMLARLGAGLKTEYSATDSEAGNDDNKAFLNNPLHLGDPEDEGKVKYIGIQYYGRENDSAMNLGVTAFCDIVYGQLHKGNIVGIMANDKNHPSSAHSFICDGYKASTNKFHFNFGWNGRYNGYHAMNAVNPGNSFDFTINTGSNSQTKFSAYVTIKPPYKLGDVNNDGIIDASDAMAIINYINNNTAASSVPAADISLNGSINGADLTYIINKMVKEGL